MAKKRNYILSIAGFDPCSGAGVIADIKTFEAHKTYGLGVITANTLQTENDFIKCIWINKDIILEQIAILFKKYKIDFVKIGIIENWITLNEIVDYLISNNPKIKIIWDPIFKSETDFEFSKEKDIFTLDKILSKIYIFTPNYEEMGIISTGKNINEEILRLSKLTNIFLKGGHRKDGDKRYYDYLYTTYGKTYPFKPKKICEYGKHGSGCVISSAITANISLGYNIIKSCLKAKDYTTYLLDSNKSKLGYHKYKPN